MLRNGHAGLYVRRMVMLKTRSEGGVCPARSDSGWGGVLHIQSASRNPRSVSDGRYLPGLVPSGAVREIACSLSAGSACS